MTLPRLAAVLIAVLAALPTTAQVGSDVYKALGIDTPKVLTGSIIQAKVLPGGEKQTVALVTYLTGKKAEDEAVNIKLGVFRRSAESPVLVFSRDYGEVNEGAVGRGELQTLDLDGDGVAEVIVTYDNGKDRLVEERRGEILLVQNDDSFKAGWSGPMSYDATKNVREIPEDRRDRFTREIDAPNTLRTRGITLFMKKRVYAVAGQRLPEPKEVQETFPLRTGE